MYMAKQPFLAGNSQTFMSALLVLLISLRL